MSKEILEQVVTDILSNDDPLLEYIRKALFEQNLMPAAQSILNEKLCFNRHEESLARLELIGINSTGYAIQPGFSGSPVWDEDARGVIGMIVAADTEKVAKATFMIQQLNCKKRSNIEMRR